jgi:PAS domain S-box-containing protein
VICTPLINQGRLSGIVYLENNRATHVFTAERLELLNLLSAQMALSLDNARLYQKAQQEIAERTQAELALRESEQRFRTIFDSVNDAIFVHDIATGDILDVNHTMCAMYGYTREEVLRLQIGDMSSDEPPYTQSDARKWMKKASEEGPLLVEWRAKDKGGRLFWIEVNMRRAVINGQDRLVVVARDITERKAIEEALRKKTEELDRYFTNSLDLLCIADTTGHFVRLNPEWEKVLGFPLWELEGREFLELVHPEDRETTQAAVHLAARKELLGFVNRYRCKDGTYRWLEWKSFPAEDMISAVARDITERKQAEVELARHRDRLEELVRERTAELEKEIAERKQAEERIKAALVEKEVLLREVHHRVKNNLNTIANIPGSFVLHV